MLTRDLLRYDQRGGRLIPRFVDSTSRLVQNLVTDLALIYATGTGQSREELSEATLPVINSYRSPLIAKGINKLLIDRCTFQEPADDVEALRFATFTAAVKHLQSEEMNDLERFRQAVSDAMHSEDPDQLALKLHADLPVRQPLIAFESIEPEPLLHRYNMAMAQGPLIWADSLIIDIHEPDPGRLRQFFRYLKFFQLMARITPSVKLAHGFRLELDGPLSLFDVARKYGIKLANFLPAVCALSKWHITATIRLGKEPEAQLELDETSRLHSHFTRTTCYVPDEFLTFAEQFKAVVKTWKIESNSPLLDLGKQEMVAPDFTFRHQSGQVIHLELFHRWHGGPLPKRLERLAQIKKPIFLAIGVDRALSKQALLAPLLAQSSWFQSHGFVFNQFPPIKRVVACLEEFLNKEGTG